MNTFIYLGLLSMVAVMSFPMSGHAQAANTTNAPSKEFRFDGGSLRDFTRKLGQQFGSNFLEMLVIRDEDADRLQIPKIKNRFLGSDMASTDWTRVLKLYNQISEEGNGSMGKWIFSPEGPRWVSDGTNTFALPPETLVFVPPQPAGGVGGAIKVRAFPIRGMPKDRLVELQGIIEQESRRMQEDIASGRLPAGQDISLAQGRLSMHQGSELLIAVGGQSYVELVQAVVDAFFVNYPFMRSVPSPKPQ